MAADLEHFTLRDDETLVVRLEAGITPSQAVEVQEHLQSFGHPSSRVILLPPIAESVTKYREGAGRVIITWPAPTTAGVLPIFGVALADADTGEQIVTAVKLALTLGTDTGYEGTVIEAEITALVDEDGNLLAEGKQYVPDPGGGLRTGVFRYTVAEMRIANA